MAIAIEGGFHGVQFRLKMNDASIHGTNHDNIQTESPTTTITSST